MQNLHTVKSRCIDSKENFIFTICQFTSGHTYNVFPDEAFMQGTIRTYNEKNKLQVYEKIRHIVEATVNVFNCKADLVF